MELRELILERAAGGDVGLIVTPGAGTTREEMTEFLNGSQLLCLSGEQVADNRLAIAWTNAEGEGRSAEIAVVDTAGVSPMLPTVPVMVLQKLRDEVMTQPPEPLLERTARSWDKNWLDMARHKRRR